MAIARAIKAPTRVANPKKQLDISDRALIGITISTVGIIFAVIMGFMAIVFFQLKADINRFDSKIDSIESKLTVRLDSIESKLTIRLDSIESKLTIRLDSIESKLTARVDKIDNKLDQVLLYLAKIK